MQYLVGYDTSIVYRYKKTTINRKPFDISQITKFEMPSRSYEPNVPTDSNDKALRENYI